MIVGVLRVDLALLEARTLKDKRRVLSSVKARLRNDFNVSVSEVAHGDSPRRSRMGLAVVGVEARAIHSQLDRMVEQFRSVGGLTLVQYERELL